MALIRSRSADSIRDRGIGLTESPDVWLQSASLNITNRKPGKPGCVHVCCTNNVKAEFHFLRAELWHRDRYGRAKTREAIQHGGTHLQLSDLAVEVTGHDPRTEQLEAAHLGLDQTASVVAIPLFPYRSAKAMSRS